MLCQGFRIDSSTALLLGAYDKHQDKNNPMIELPGIGHYFSC
jgi:hypothetical protein